MTRHLPSLSSLRAFEAIARHRSFTRAGTELNLTQTAISHRIKELEALLTVQLFIRKQGGVALTDEGQVYLEAIRPALSQIAVASESISSANGSRLTVACMSAFALRCLIPALGSFRERHPDIALQIAPTAIAERANLHNFDAAIWYGTGDRSDLDVTPLGAEEIFPVCTPALLAACPDLSLPAAVLGCPVIRTVSPIITDEWPAWLLHAGEGSTEFEQEIFCEGLYFSMGATLSGLGIGLARTSLVAADLASGRLVEPFDVRLATESTYYLVSRPERSSLPKVLAFKNWLLETFPAVNGEA
jgi:LysR family glycine cleavage system transcriptional activator